MVHQGTLCFVGATFSLCQPWFDAWPGLEGDSPKPRGFLRSAQSSPGHPTVPRFCTGKLTHAARQFSDSDCAECRLRGAGCRWLRGCSDLSFHGKDFLGHGDVIKGTRAGRREVNDRLPETWRFGQLDVATDPGLEDLS